MSRASGGTLGFAREQKQPAASSSGELAHDGGLFAQQRPLDLTPVVDVVRAGVRGAAVTPELELEEIAWRGVRAGDGALLAFRRGQHGAFVAVAATFGVEAPGAATGERMERGFGLCVTFARSAVEG